MPVGVYMYPAGHAGVALYTYNLSNALADKGLRVTLFCDDRYELDHLPARFDKANVLSSRYEGIRLNKGPISRMVGILYAHLYNSWKFLKCVQRGKPEIVHLHSFFFYPIEWYLLYRLRRTKSKIVITVHNVIPYRFYLWSFERLELAILQYIYNSAHKLIVHSNINKQQLLSWFSVDEERVAVIPHGEYCVTVKPDEASKAEAWRKLNLRRGQEVILFFGYIRKIKGIDILIKAFDEVAKKFPDVVLIIAGSVIEGQCFENYRQMIGDMKFGDRVRCFIRYVEHDDIALFFEPATIVVLPYTEFYGQSGVLHLAQGFGKAVVVTDVGGLIEAVDNGKTGLIVPAGDAKSLAGALTYLLENEPVRVEMGRQARKIAANRFSWEAIAGATLEKAYGGETGTPVGSSALDDDK
jgi:D-inositol-3-phosphate glycosyltransferase